MRDSSRAARTSAAAGSTRSGCRAVTPPRIPTATGPERFVNGSPGRGGPASRTGQAIGGVGPVGHPPPIRTPVDTWLDNYDVIWAAARHPHTVFPPSYADLIRLTGRVPADLRHE